MPRKVILEEQILEFFSGWSNECRLNYGLLIGQSSKYRDFIVHCPRTVNKPQHFILSQVNGYSLCNHAKMLTGMLPGGFWVLGAFFLCPEEIFIEEKSFFKCMTMMSNMQDLLENSPQLCGTPPRKQLLLFHMSPRTRQAGCAEFSLESSGIKPVDHTFASLSSDWLVGKYVWNSRPGFTLLDPMGNLEKEHKLRDMLSEFSDVIESGSMKINGELVETDEDVLKKYVSRNTNKVDFLRSTDETADITSQFTIYVYLTGETGVDPVHGDCPSIDTNLIFIHQDATVAEAFRAAKNDILRSWAARLEVHIDSLTSGQGKKRFEQSRRVVVVMPKVRIPFSHYLYSDEAMDSTRFKEVIHHNLGFRSKEPHYIIDPQRLEKIEKHEDFLDHEEEDKTIVKFFITLAALILGLSSIYFSVFNK